MAEEYPEYIEPDLHQLANFMVVYSAQIVGEHSFDLNPTVIEKLLANPTYKAAALKHHRKFYDEAKILHGKMERGKLRCMFVRENGKRCVNWNEPGSFYCGIETHKAEALDDDSRTNIAE